MPLRLGTACPYDALHHDQAFRRNGKREEGALVIPRRTQRLGHGVETIERSAHDIHLVVAKDTAPHEEPS